MWRVYSILIFLVVNVVALAQQPARYDHYNFEQRQALYPFNATSYIKLVSFGIKNRHHTPDGRRASRIPIKDDIPDLSLMDQVVRSPKEDIDSIADILFNTCYRLDSTLWAPAFCYLPRNAILFFDAMGTNFAYIEICFECERMRMSSSEIYQDTFSCDNRYEDLQRFFERRGLKTKVGELKDELKSLSKTDLDSLNFVDINRRKLRKELDRFSRKHLKKNDRKDSGFQHSDVEYIFPLRIHENQKLITVDIKVKSEVVYMLTIIIPSYRVWEVIDLR